MSIRIDRILVSAQRFRRLVLIICALPLVNCGDGGDGTGVDDGVDPGLPAAITDGQWYRPTVAVTWQWQLQGDVNTGVQRRPLRHRSVRLACPVTDAKPQGFLLQNNSL